MSSKKNLVLFSAFLLVYQVSTYLSNDMYVAALPSMMNYFSCTRESIEWTVFAFILGSPLCVMFISPLSQKFGRKPCLIISVLVFISFSLLCTLTSDIKSLIFFRLLQGSVISCIMVAGYATVQEVFHGKEAFVMLSRMTSIVVLAPAAGPVIGSFLIDYYSWKSSFYLVAFMGMLSFFGLLKYMPTQTKKEQKLSISEALKHYFSLLKLPVFTLGPILAGFVLAQFFAWITLSPAILMSYFDISIRSYGLIQIPVIGAFSCASLCVKPLLDKYKPEKLMLIGICINCIGCALFGISATLYELSVLQIVISMTICSLGSGLIMPLLNRITVMTGTAPMDYKSALYSLIYTICATICSVIMSKIYTYYPIPSSLAYYNFTLGTIIILLSYLQSRSIKHYHNQLTISQKKAAKAELITPLHG